MTEKAGQGEGASTLCCVAGAWLGGWFCVRERGSRGGRSGLCGTLEDFLVQVF